jgi:glycosyltransferase involved in cell wall biosynthesis
MGAGASVIAWDVNFNREVLEGSGRFFSSSLQLASLIEDAELQPQLAARRGAAARSRAATTYRWDEVAEGYEQLCTALTTKRRKRFQLLQQN